jgi:hypothetical protein
LEKETSNRLPPVKSIERGRPPENRMINPGMMIIRDNAKKK